jgi:hypothetical protein
VRVRGRLVNGHGHLHLFMMSGVFIVARLRFIRRRSRWLCARKRGVACARFVRRLAGAASHPAGMRRGERARRQHPGQQGKPQQRDHRDARDGEAVDASRV